MVVAEYERLLHASYASSRDADGTSHSFRGNLESVPGAAWDWLPPGGARSIRDLVIHVGGCKYVYADWAFGARKLGWEAPPAYPAGWRTMEPAELRDWLDEGQRTFMKSVAHVGDADLGSTTLAPWGEDVQVRWVLATMIEHDYYHAGEVNHLRSLFERADRWAWEQDEKR
jgi:hypothetical protein